MKIIQKILIIAAFAIVVLDEILKNLALKNLPGESEISSNNFLELAIHKNNGIAFDLPVWLPLVAILTTIIIAALAAIAIKTRQNQPWIATSALIIICGAIGNLFDRLFYGFTVDYLITPATGSAFNLSDIVIIGGLVLLVLKKHRKV